MRAWSGLAISLAVVTLVGCTQNVNNSQVPVTQLNSSSAAFVTYTVQTGDTLSGIADQHHITYIDLARLNHIPSPYIIHIGQTLRIPNPQYAANSVETQQKEYGGDIVPVTNQNSLPAQNLNLAQYNAPGAAAPQPSAATNVVTNNAAPANTQQTTVQQPAARAVVPAARTVPQQAHPVKVQPAAPAPQAAQTAPQVATAKEVSPVKPVVASTSTGQRVTIIKQSTNNDITWSWPVSGRIVEGFGQGQGLMAKGVQIRTRSDAKVLAAAPGTVIYSGTGVNEYGKMIIIKSDGNFLTAYTNLSKLLVKQGQTIIRGGPIGVVGTIDGQAILHFEIRKFGSPVDPMQYMPS